MEVVEEVMAVPPPPPPPTNKDLSSPIAIKGKRTKRLRPHSPISFTITTPLIDDNDNRNNRNNSNIIINNNNNSNDDNNLHLSHSFSPASSEESTTSAEVDIARCLILLSRGHFPNYPPNDHQYNSKLQNTKNKYNNNNDSNNNSNNKTCGYTCKTCNRVFPSFQALGGHRASHKKPKNEKKMAILSDEDDFPSPSMSSSKKRFLSNSLSLQLSNISSATFSATPKSSPSPRIHECSYCGAEFTSGQALGGHMRKHRGGPTNRTASFPIELEIEGSKIKPRNLGLSLDLNLPAPEEKNEGGATTGHVLSTTPPPLVDCRY